MSQEMETLNVEQFHSKGIKGIAIEGSDQDDTNNPFTLVIETINTKDSQDLESFLQKCLPITTRYLKPVFRQAVSRSLVYAWAYWKLLLYDSLDVLM